MPSRLLYFRLSALTLRCLLSFGALCGVSCTSGGEKPKQGTGPLVATGGAANSAIHAGGANAGAAASPTYSLPFAVDLAFDATGFMGDAIEGGLADDPNLCLSRREGAQGDCHAFTYSGVTSSNGWVGLYWLSAPENWGAQPGASIAPGARRVSFLAASDTPSLQFKFLVGGIDSELSYTDSFEQHIEATLGVDFQRFSIDLQEFDYSAGVLGGFGWSTASSANFTLFIDDIRWE